MLTSVSMILYMYIHSSFVRLAKCVNKNGCLVHAARCKQCPAHFLYLCEYILGNICFSWIVVLVHVWNSSSTKTVLHSDLKQFEEEKTSGRTWELWESQSCSSHSLYGLWLQNQSNSRTKKVFCLLDECSILFSEMEFRIWNEIRHSPELSRGGSTHCSFYLLVKINK